MSISINFLTGSDAVAPAQSPVIVVLRLDGGFGKHATALNENTGGMLDRACASPRCKGESGEIIDLLAPVGVSARRIIILDLGPKSKITALSAMKAGAELAKRLEVEAETAATLLADPVSDAALPSSEVIARLLLGMRLRNYRFALMPKQDTSHDIALTLVANDGDRAAIDRLSAVAEGVSLARTLVNYPASHLHPDNFGDHLAPLREAGISVEEYCSPDLERLGMGAILAVGNGSDRKPRLFTLEYKGEGASGKPLALVGKGMCFDAGGLCIKTGPQMFTMKGDMGGAAAVIGTMLALARQKTPIHVVGVLAVAENMLSGSSYKPGDIVTTMSGRTVEVYDTDCEGRMVLSDALHYTATRFDPCAIVDLATLTYSVMRGLGHAFAGLFATHDELATALLAAGEKTGERFWRLPLDPAYDDGLRSQVADLRQHSHDLEDGDALFAAAFLKNFAEGRPWVHLDIAGKELIGEDRLLARSGGAGFGVQILEEWITSNSASLQKLS
ncbi:leucyl aminopeptidase [Rhizobium sp. KVB221]|uniref:Probable cytosol aminopeptidase n=1 Tax=Rhizobium setariae TaxID=2801340 RepID=A0A937CNZ1_9HYPH|nr:leucyl aminopeptidase [Rhizobium setariae]MBL0374316.1 leucyl aminopeptidase [Rhizobium setariae]